MIAPDDWSLRYYQTEDGRVPFREWRDAVSDRKAATAIRNRLYRLQRGLFGHCKAVGEGVMELRIDVGPGYRGYFYRSGRRVILLLCGGDKSTQTDDIKAAKQYRRDYEQRTRRTLDPG